MMTRRGAVAALAAPLVGEQAEQPGMFADADAYERFMGRWSRQLAPMLVAFAGVPDRGRVLDLGSGTGSLAFSIAEKRVRCQVVGVDPSKEYVSYAERRNRFGARVQFQVGDAQRLEFRDREFDGCLSLLVFNFIPDRKQALNQAKRVTKPGGGVAAAVWDYGSGMTMLRTFFDAAVAMEPGAARLSESNMPLCREGELREFWKEGGLAQVEERALEFAMRFNSLADYWEPFLLGQGPAGAYMRGVTGERRAALRREVMRRLGVKDENTPFSLAARAWAVRGVVAAGPA